MTSSAGLLQAEVAPRAADVVWSGGAPGWLGPWLAAAPTRGLSAADLYASPWAVDVVAALRRSLERTGDEPRDGGRPTGRTGPTGRRRAAPR